MSVLCQTVFALLQMYLDQYVCKTIKEIDEELGEDENGNKNNSTQLQQRKLLKHRYTRLRLVCTALVFLVLFSNIYIAAFDNFSNNGNSLGNFTSTS